MFLYLNLLFCYGARQEIVNAVKTIVEEIKLGRRTEKDLTPDLFSSYLWTVDTPDPDLIIRTGGVKRLSNFLLYQAATVTAVICLVATSYAKLGPAKTAFLTLSPKTSSTI